MLLGGEEIEKGELLKGKGGTERIVIRGAWPELYTLLPFT